MAEKPTRDWEAIERDYRAGRLTHRELGAVYGVTHAAIQKWARERGWVKEGLPRSTPAPGVAVVNRDGNSRAGFVYVIYQDCEDRIYKIGMSSAPESRLKTHQCASPYELRIACVYFVPDMRAEESALHETFKDRLVRGEWYRLTRDDLQQIAARSLLEPA